MFTANRIGTPVFVNAGVKTVSGPAALNTQALNASANFLVNMYNPAPISGPYSQIKVGNNNVVNIARGLQWGIGACVSALPPAQDINAVGVEIDMNLIGHLPGNVEAVPVIGYSAQGVGNWDPITLSRGVRQLGPSNVQAATTVVGRGFQIKEQVLFESVPSTSGIGGAFFVGWLFFDHGTGAAVNVGGWHFGLAVRSLDRNLNYYNPRS